MADNDTPGIVPVKKPRTKKKKKKVLDIMNMDEEMDIFSTGPNSDSNIFAKEPSQSEPFSLMPTNEAVTTSSDVKTGANIDDLLGESGDLFSLTRPAEATKAGSSDDFFKTDDLGIGEPFTAPFLSGKEAHDDPHHMFWVPPDEVLEETSEIFDSDGEHGVMLGDMHPPAGNMVGSSALWAGEDDINLDQAAITLPDELLGESTDVIEDNEEIIDREAPSSPTPELFPRDTQVDVEDANSDREDKEIDTADRTSIESIETNKNESDDISKQKDEGLETIVEKEDSEKMEFDEKTTDEDIEPEKLSVGSADQTEANADTPVPEGKCCNCDLIALPVGDMVKKRFLEETSIRLAMEDLVKVLESENLQLRENVNSERGQIEGLQESIIHFKAEVSEGEKVAEKYRAQCEELQEGLVTARKMQAVLEEQLATANNYKSGMDYMLESQLAQGRMAAAESRAQAAQSELLQSQGEVQRLLERLAEESSQRREMVSLAVHQELLGIADEKAREAELRSSLLQTENHQLKERLKELEQQEKQGPRTPTTGQRLGDWNQALLQHTMEETSKIVPLPTKFSEGYLAAANETLARFDRPKPPRKPRLPSRGEEERLSRGEENLPDLADLEAAKPAQPEKTQTPRPSQGSDDSDWSSDEGDGAGVRSPVVLSPTARSAAPMLPVPDPAKQIRDARASLHKTSDAPKKPPIAQKPKLPPKPPRRSKPLVLSSRPLTKTKEQSDTMEKPVSFEQDASAASLHVPRRPKGPAGRRKPDRQPTEWGQG